MLTNYAARPTRSQCYRKRKEGAAFGRSAPETQGRALLTLRDKPVSHARSLRSRRPQRQNSTECALSALNYFLFPTTSPGKHSRIDSIQASKELSFTRSTTTISSPATEQWRSKF